MTARSRACSMARRAAGLRGADDGQVLLLSIAYGVLALVLVAVVVSASGVHLERKRLLALADLTALAAADAIDPDAYFSREAGDALVPLSDAAVRAEAAGHLSTAAPATGLDDVTLVDVRTDGRTATVTLSAVATPVWLTWVTEPWWDGIRLVVTSSARAG